MRRLRSTSRSISPSHGSWGPEALASGEREEGYLTIGDVLELDLDARFVVLSACDTVWGEAKAGEGVESLARAFMHAGARGVVASLWQVEDRAAAETMEGIYRGTWKGGQPPSRSLREGKLALRRSTEPRRVPGGGGRRMEAGNPFYWAPFIDIGLPR